VRSSLPFGCLPLYHAEAAGRATASPVRSSLPFWVPAALPCGSGRTRHGFARALIPGYGHIITGEPKRKLKEMKNYLPPMRYFFPYPANSMNFPPEM
jgi:hypothetical protein